jgi:alpha-D-ribose 1-methylphosphonate 5-triphosphate diphosphatase
MMPRPGVDFPTDVALIETDRQVVANGITTVFHGVTWSWEPGLRGPENARAILEGMERLRPQLAADTRFHLRHETYNLDAEPEISEWLAGRRIDLLAFNDHMTLTVEASNRAGKKTEMVKRSGLSEKDFDCLVERVKRRSNEVPDSIARLAEAAVASGVPLLSHDDTSPAQRRWFRSLGCRVAEFPTTVETAQEAASQGDDIVFGAPNIVRGGSHTGWTSAADMVESGLCSILASDYYYPAPLLAAFRLAADNVAPLEKAWTLVSQAPAAAVGLTDRGRVAPGQRADLIVVDAREPRRPQVVATIVAGRIVHLADADRLFSS